MNLLWQMVAFFVSRRPVAAWLIRRAMRTPYFHLDGYMERYWLFNPYGGSSSDQATASSDRDRHSARRWAWLPSIRLHHIRREDLADHPHDHPWDARTIILDGWYIERQYYNSPWRPLFRRRVMRGGDTSPIRHGSYHHIEQVSAGGVWTLFFTWDYQGSWGFLVDGDKVPWREYEAKYQRHEAATDHGATAGHAAPCGGKGQPAPTGPDSPALFPRQGDPAGASPSAISGRWHVVSNGHEIVHGDFGADVVLLLTGDFATGGGSMARRVCRVRR